MRNALTRPVSDLGTSYGADPGGWRASAACRGADPELFRQRSQTELKTFKHKPQAHPSLREAYGYCGRCPVREECLADALAETQFARVGVWGGVHFGFTEAERNLARAREAADLKFARKETRKSAS
ncbi:WhiB family transcriptional regulator [Saccharopolyspora sp. WRP15-2]|uniref:WhiB family transcriptional regulator n=1 Tax=Saccharopolyspora oryzae TaxID=2997343 RepID=A0ABT4URK0_9PSEU|nr:WhiB family transcriptional regulator [Saccharopolyspora oryzae]MDA3624289.1 WhiB family transcriptional regulator [Saccharopolyspora oryzae]